MLRNRIRVSCTDNSHDDCRAALMNMQTRRRDGRNATPQATRAQPSVAKSWLRAIEITARIETEPQRLLADVIDEWARPPRRSRPRSLSDRESFSYRAISPQRINRYARWALANGIGMGDIVCLLMPNRPDYLAIWLGITSVGGVVGADQHQAGRRLAGALHRRRRAGPHHRRRRTGRRVRRRWRAPRHRRRRSGCMAATASGRIDQALAALAGDALATARAPRRHDRRSARC